MAYIFFRCSLDGISLLIRRTAVQSRNFSRNIQSRAMRIYRTTAISAFHFFYLNDFVNSNFTLRISGVLMGREAMLGMLQDLANL